MSLKDNSYQSKQAAMHSEVTFICVSNDMKEVKRLCSAVPSFSAKKDTSITEGNPTGMSAKKSDSIREIKKSQDRKPLSLTDDTEVSELTYGIKNIPHILSSINLLVFLLYSQIM